MDSLKPVKDFIIKEVPKIKYIKLLLLKDFWYLCTLDICRDINNNYIDNVCIIYNQTEKKICIDFNKEDALLVFTCFLSLLFDLKNSLKKIIVYDGKRVLLNLPINITIKCGIDTIDLDSGGIITPEDEVCIESIDLPTIFMAILGGNAVELVWEGSIDAPLLFLVTEYESDCYFLGLELDRIDKS